MMLNFDLSEAGRYNSERQTIRDLTETWLGINGYCPNCGSKPITKFENNRPVADFFCSNCDEQFELKSKAGLSNGRKVPDGTYNTMISRIQADDNPNFFFLSFFILLDFVFYLYKMELVFYCFLLFSFHKKNMVSYDK